MTKYKVVSEISSVEFLTLNEATNFQSTLGPGVQIITVEEPEEPEEPEIFLAISARQIRLQLLTLGITEEIILPALNSLPSPTKEAALIEWGFSASFERTHPLVDMVGGMLGWGATELDALWREAIKL